MVQLRVMTDDRERGEDVLAVLLPLLQACTALQASEPTRLSHRGGGLRVVLDVQLAGAPAVRIEREDGPTASRTRTGRGGAPARRQRRPALPLGG
ncbi:hypothetical protein [Streptomyces malaysiensis]|uniref:hypothetical protein n=1 Tax=Streptomyces malaysiensis TaxID=92644 RepID=UPI000BFD7E94|nr:hypothetical protein [Streptomyces malaysiensis]ATL88747.1 hypothetical protein SMALA_8601 [Streptomyces malaysiensis]